MSEEKKLSKDKRAFHWLHAWMRWYNVKFIPLLRLASPKKTKEALREQKEIYQYLKSLIESSGEPSEAELEEFVEKEAKVWGHFSPRQKEVVKDFIWEVIKEYDKLRRGQKP